jgi:hypothetical protein
MMDSQKTARHWIRWRFFGALLISLSVAAFMTSLWPQGWYIIFAIAIPFCAMLYVLMSLLEGSLRSFWLGDSKQKRQAVYQMILTLFAPLSIFFYLLELGVAIAVYMAAVMLLWSLPAVKFELDGKTKNNL